MTDDDGSRSDIPDEVTMDSESAADGVTDVDELREIVRRVEEQLSSERELSFKYAEQNGQLNAKFRGAEKNLSTAYRFWIPAAFLVGTVLTMILIAE